MILDHLNEIILTSLRLPPYLNNQNMQQLPIVLPFYKRVARGFVWYLNFTERGGGWFVTLWTSKRDEAPFHVVTTSRLPWNLIHKKRHLKFSPLNLWHIKCCVKEKWCMNFSQVCAIQNQDPTPPPHLYNPLTTLSHQHRVGLVQQQ